MKERNFRCGTSVVFASALLILASATPVQSQKKGGGTRVPDYPIRVTFRNNPGDRVLSVAGSTYTDGEINQNGEVSVWAKIASSNGWAILDTRSCTGGKRGIYTCVSLGRSHLLDFSDGVETATPLPPANGENGWVDSKIMAPARIEVLPVAEDGSQLKNGFRGVMNYPGEQRQTGFSVNFTDSTGLITAETAFHLRNRLLVTYLGGSLACDGDQTPCARWTVETVTYGGLDDIANLQSVDHSIYYGTFRMPAGLTIEVLPTP